MNGQTQKERKEKILQIPARIRAQKPLVHMLPNAVTAALCADGLSALGARPLMAKAPQEMKEIVSYADAVVVNMGQPDKEKLRAAALALDAACAHKKPVVFDPVGAGASAYRYHAYQRLLKKPWTGIVKGNRSEIDSLQSDKILHHGVDTVGNPVVEYKKKDQRVWAVSGAEDFVFSKTVTAVLPHFAGWRVPLTGTGCLTGAVMGACYAVEKDACTAALAAFTIMACAGAQAGYAGSYGNLKTALLDGLFAVTEEAMEDMLLGFVVTEVKR